MLLLLLLLVLLLVQQRYLQDDDDDDDSDHQETISIAFLCSTYLSGRSYVQYYYYAVKITLVDDI
jgi:hypothetical protein